MYIEKVTHWGNLKPSDLIHLGPLIEKVGSDRAFPERGVKFSAGEKSLLMKMSRRNYLLRVPTDVMRILHEQTPIVKAHQMFELTMRRGYWRLWFSPSSILDDTFLNHVKNLIKKYDEKEKPENQGSLEIPYS